MTSRLIKLNCYKYPCNIYLGIHTYLSNDNPPDVDELGGIGPLRHKT